MVETTIEVDSNLDLIFEQQTLSAYVKADSSGSHIIESAGNLDLNEINDQQGDLVASSADIETSSGQNLSWTFFEEISSLDKHLSKEETSASPPLDQMTTLANGARLSVTQPDTASSNPKTTTTTTTIAIVQQSPDDVICQPQHYQAVNLMNTSTESPTSTIKRNHQKLNHNNNNNNQRSLKTKNQPINSPYDQIVSPSTNSFIIGNIGATSSGFPGDDEEGSDIIHILRNDTMIGAGPGAGTDSGTATTRSTKLRTLPPIGSRNQAGVYATDVDLVVGSSGTGGGIARRPSVADKTNAMGTAPNSGGQRIQQAGGSTFTDGMDYHLGLIGWRKKCLYSLLFMLMLLIIVNLVLTLWILKVMEFSSEGMGQLKIVPGGIQLTGQALFMDLLRASNIRSRHGQPISIESSRNFSINTRDANGILENHLFLGHDKLECLSTEFRINDTTGRNLFSVNRDEVTIGAHALRIDGEGGAIFRESIQTPHVRAEAGRDLRFESPTRQLEMSAAKDITLQSRGGSIEVSALEDIKLSALDGSIRFDSSKIMMPNLRTVQPSTPGTGPNHDHQHRVFQLCACANGKLFLASAHSICAGDDETICR